MIAGRHTHQLIAALGLGLACGGRLSGSEGADEGETATSEPDLPASEPGCEGSGVTVAGECSSNVEGQACQGIQEPDVGVPICASLSSGPDELELGSGMAACGCGTGAEAVTRDLDGDGADELLATCRSPHGVLIWPGRADGSLGCAALHEVVGPDSLWFVDVDEDGREDLITIGHYTLAMSLLPAIEPGVFGEAQSLPLPEQVETLPVGRVGATIQFDVDGDGREEFLTSRALPATLLEPIMVWSIEGGSPSLSLDSFGERSAKSLHRADVDGDGRDDLVAASSESWWARGSTDGLGLPQPLDGASNLGRVGFGDVDGDGLADLVFGATPPRYRLGVGDGSFGPDIEADAGGLPMDEAGYPALVADLDGDGRVEIVIDRDAEGWRLWRSSESGPRFDLQINIGYTHGFTAGDLDGDGRGDLVTSSWFLEGPDRQITRWYAGG